MLIIRNIKPRNLYQVHHKKDCASQEQNCYLNSWNRSQMFCVHLPSVVPDFVSSVWQKSVKVKLPNENENAIW